MTRSSTLSPTRRRLLSQLLCAAFLFAPASLLHAAAPAPAKEAAPPEKKQPEKAETPEKKSPENPGTGFAQRLLDRLRGVQRSNPYERNHESVKAVFREIIAPVSHSTVVVLVDDEPVALGAIIDSDGHILTKASQCTGRVRCQLRDGRQLDAATLGVHGDHDLALLKIEAADLTPITWADSRGAMVGSFLATPGATDDPLAIGVISVIERRIPPSSGVLGVRLEEDEHGPRIEEIFPDSGAEKAGLLLKDIVLKVNGKRTKTLPEMINYVRGRKAGEQVKLTIRRGEEELEITATLGNHFPGPPRNRADYQNNLGGELSGRRAGFPKVIQHDSVLKPHECGGPIVGLDGKVLGINIARAGRVASYALPASVVQSVLAELRSGKLAPPSPEMLLAQQLQEAANALAARAAALTQHETAISDAEKALEAATKALAEATTAKAAAEQQLGELRAALLKSQAAVKAAQQEHDRLNKEQATVTADMPEKQLDKPADKK